MKKCPRGHKAKGNPTGGNECVKCKYLEGSGLG